MLVDILLEDDIIMLAKVVEECGKQIKVKYFVPTNKKYEDQQVYNYDDTIEEVDIECVNGYYEKDSDETAAGFVYIQGVGFIRSDDQSEYDPQSETDSSSDESDSDLEDEEEDEEL